MLTIRRSSGPGPSRPRQDVAVRKEEQREEGGAPGRGEDRYQKDGPKTRARWLQT